MHKYWVNKIKYFSVFQDYLEPLLCLFCFKSPGEEVQSGAFLRYNGSEDPLCVTFVIVSEENF